MTETFSWTGPIALYWYMQVNGITFEVLADIIESIPEGDVKLDWEQQMTDAYAVMRKDDSPIKYPFDNRLPF